MLGLPVLGRSGRDLRVSWQSSDPDGTLFQLYRDKQLAWHGPDRSVILPYPKDIVRIDVGTVADGEGAIDFSGSLPSYPDTHVTIAWQGGAWLGDVVDYLVYGSAVAGGAVDYGAVLAVVPATSAGVDLSGWGLGGWGEGTWGAAAQNYSWRSQRLGSGVWTFGVRARDSAGNQGSTNEVSFTVVAPPRPPATNAAGKRLTYTYNSSTRVPTLHWLATPG